VEGFSVKCRLPIALGGEILYIISDGTLYSSHIQGGDTPMEPQTEITNPPEQNQATPAKESLRSMLASPRYWLAALLPIISIAIAVLYPYFIFGAPGGLMWSFLLGPTTSFLINIFLPFCINFRRAILIGLPSLFLITAWFLWFYLSNHPSGPEASLGYYVVYCIAIPLVMLTIVSIMFFGWLGAKVGIARGHKA
jgi:hypothetical protein